MAGNLRAQNNSLFMFLNCRYCYFLRDIINFCMVEDISPNTFVIAWYREKDWPQWMQIPGNDMCPTFQEWKVKALDLLGESAKEGHPATTQIIRPGKFLDWCETHHQPPNARTRIHYATLCFEGTIKMYETERPDAQVARVTRKQLQKVDGKDFSDLFEPFLKRPKDASCPIFRLVDEMPEQFGTGTLLKLGYHHFLLTASHVLDDMIDGNVLVPGEEGWPFIEGELIGTKKPSSNERKDDKSDIGIIRLDDEVVATMHKKMTFLEGSEIEGVHVTEKGGAYVIAGYPAHKTKMIEGQLHAHPYTFSGDGVTDHRYDKLGRDPQHHMLIQHRQNKALHYQTMRQGVKVEFEGVSGGGVFAWDKNFPHPMGFTQPKLVGIVNEYNPYFGVFAATKLACYLAIMHNRYPDLPLQHATNVEA